MRLISCYLARSTTRHGAAYPSSRCGAKAPRNARFRERHAFAWAKENIAVERH